MKTKKDKKTETVTKKDFADVFVTEPAKRIDLGKSLACFFDMKQPESFKRQATAMALVLSGLDRALGELDTANYVKVLNRLDPALRTAHEMIAGLLREKDAQGDACTAQSALKAALQYYNPSQRDITMKLYAPPVIVKPPPTVRQRIRTQFYTQPRNWFWTWVYKQIFSKP